MRFGPDSAKRHRDEALEVDWPAAALCDVDTPDDYETVNAGFESAASGTEAAVVDAAVEGDPVSGSCE